jgi:hypothetical protein
MVSGDSSTTRLGSEQSLSGFRLVVPRAEPSRRCETRSHVVSRDLDLETSRC